MQGRRTALIVVVPEAEAAVGRWRCRFDPVARLGVPAHVSVLHPFMPAAEIDDAVLHRTAHLFAEVVAFAHQLVRVDWFGDDVLWLASDAAEEFRSLTDLVYAEFPACPPYEGRFNEVVPHLTVADRAPVENMREAERAVSSHLPIRALTGQVSLLVEQASGVWQPTTSFALGASS